MALKALDQRLAGGASSPSPPQRPANGSAAPPRSGAPSAEASGPKKSTGEADIADVGEAPTKVTEDD